MQRKVLVTGGSGGIGAAICRKFAEEGCLVYINYRSSQEKAERVAAETGGIAVRFDVSDADAVRRAISEIGAPDVLVNNAGVSEVELFTALTDDRARRLLETDLIGTMNCARAVLPGMIRRHFGCIVNISSMWGEVGASCEVDYSAAKAGVIGFTKALAKEAAPSGIRVNCVSPGFIMTEMNSRYTPDELEAIREEIPLGIFGEPEHVAEAVEFLASERAAYITGQVLGVNGGMVI